MEKIRKEIENIRPIYKDLLVLGGEMTTGLISRKAVLSILDKWELVAETIVKEGEFLKERGELLGDVVSRALLFKYDEIVSPGDRFAIYRLPKEEDGEGS